MLLILTTILATVNCACTTCSYFFFFFQAEDGIRDLTVTGVQTCALPISHAGHEVRRVGRFFRRFREPRARRGQRSAGRARSEERRVGKEGRFRWAPDH